MHRVIRFDRAALQQQQQIRYIDLPRPRSVPRGNHVLCAQIVLSVWKCHAHDLGLGFDQVHQIYSVVAVLHVPCPILSPPDCQKYASVNRHDFQGPAGRQQPPSGGYRRKWIGDAGCVCKARDRKRSACVALRHCHFKFRLLYRAADDGENNTSCKYLRSLDENAGQIKQENSSQIIFE